MADALGSAVMRLVRVGVADMAACARQTTITTLAALLAALLAMAAIGCAIAALWIFAAPRIGPSGAALCAAGCLLVLCLVVLWLAPVMARRRRRPPSLALLPAASPDGLLAEAARLMEEHKGTALMAALIVGLLAGSDRRR